MDEVVYLVKEKGVGFKNGDGLSPDIVDLVSSEAEVEVIEIGDDVADDVKASTKTFNSQASQNHPRRIIAAARKRKREQQQAKKREEDRRKKRHEAFLKQGGVNFIIIDDSSDDDEGEEAVEIGEGSYEHKKTVNPPRTTRPSTSRHMLSDREGTSFQEDREFNYQFSHEAAQEMQERLFREAAERVARMRTTEDVASPPSLYPHHASSSGPRFSSPAFDISEIHPHHWRWKDPHACLGLPRNASLALVKSQYRRLAKLYHPDKSNHPDTSSRFHAIFKAYRKLSHAEE